MKQIIFNKDKEFKNCYTTFKEYTGSLESLLIEKNENQKFDLALNLLSYLFDDSYDFTKDVKETIVNNDTTGISSNLIHVGIEDDGMITFADVFASDSNDPEYELSIHKDDLIKLIDKWYELIEQDPDAIILTRKKDGFEFSAKFNK